MKKIKLDEYEQEILTSIENEEWKSIGNLTEELNKIKGYAQNTLEKQARISIDISEKDLLNLKRKSLEAGVPYDILIHSLIHSFATDKLKLSF